MQSNVKIHIENFLGTSLTILSQINFEGLTYENDLNSDGYCEFTCRSDDPRLTPSIVAMNNRVKIYEGSTCVFFGIINNNSYNLNTIKIRAISVSSILKDRIAGGFTAGASYPTVIGQILTTMNSLENTGITLGTVALAGTVSKTYTGSETVEYVLKDLIGANNQLYINPLGVLNVAPILGNDLSSTVVFKYDIRQIENSNLINFLVTENGQDIVTRILAKDNGAGAVVVDNPTLQALYGKVERVINYYSVSGVPALTIEANKDFLAPAFTPDITLSPKVLDNFNVGDTVGVKLYNKFVNIDTKYQILQKTVTYIGTQKQIKVKLNNNSKDLLDYIKEQAKQITQLQNN